MTLLTQSQYAKARGVSRQAVSLAVKEGRIPLLDGKIDPAVADVAFDAEMKTAPVMLPMYSESKAAKAAYEARLRKIQYETLAGKLIPYEEAQHLYLQMILQARDILLAMPAAIADEIAIETNPRKVAAIIDREVRRSLERLSRAVQNVKRLRDEQRKGTPQLEAVGDKEGKVKSNGCSIETPKRKRAAATRGRSDVTT